MSRSKLHGKKILLCTSTTNYKCNVIWRTSSSTKTLHFLYEERNECTRILNTCFSLLVEICLISRTTTLSYAKEVIFHTFSSLQVNLRRQIALGIHLIIHIQRSVLRITKVALSIGQINTFAKCFFIAVTCPNLLTFFSMNDGSTCVLTKRQLSFARNFSIAKEGQCYIFIICTCLWITKNLSHLLVMTTTKHKTHIRECLICHFGQSFSLNFENRFTFKLANRHMVFG